MCIFAVTPLAGVWIEIRKLISSDVFLDVTPLAGVWIEINIASAKGMYKKSLPLRECGLKFRQMSEYGWTKGHSPCGSVD